MRNEFLVFGKPDIREEDIAEVIDSLRAGWIGTGPKVRRFECMLEEYVGVSHVRCVSSCSAALFLGLKCLGVGSRDDVLVPAMTFVASANAVEHVGARPVFIDSDPDTGLIDLNATEAAIGPRTRAIMPVHLAGRPVDVDQLNALRDRYGLLVIEDAAHAIGARWRGRPIGAAGNLVAFSFYATKNITTSEGGALATDDPQIAARVEQLALHGLSLGAWQRFSDAGYRHYEASEVGFKFNMTDVHAALGLKQLPRLDAAIDYRAKLWQRYDEQLVGLPLQTPSPATDEMRHARHLYQVLLRDEASISRDELLERMTRNNIGVGVHYRGVHLHPYYRDRYAIDPASLPVATDISARTLSLPLGTNVSYADQDDVIAALRTILSDQHQVPGTRS
jgi:dTDP-4-amino-4,6-dideoxygalactose transaminase